MESIKNGKSRNAESEFELGSRSSLLNKVRNLTKRCLSGSGMMEPYLFFCASGMAGAFVKRSRPWIKSEKSFQTSAKRAKCFVDMQQQLR